LSPRHVCIGTIEFELLSVRAQGGFVTEAVERVVNLALFLAATPVPVTAERVRTEVLGYPQGQDDAAFLRMFERDKDDLKRMGFVIDGDAEGYYRLDVSATYATALELTPSEMSALRIAGTALAEDPSFPFGSDLRLALAKLSAEVDAGQVRVSARLADEDPRRQGSTVAALSSAVSARKRVAFDYTNSLGVAGPHEIEPYGLFLHDGRWYLVGRDAARDDTRTYTGARIADATVNPVAPKSPDFDRPADFDIARFVRLPFQFGSEEFEAEIAIAPEAAWRARSLASGQGELRPEAGGAVTWRVSARSRERLLRFVIENGPGVELVGPPELLATLADGLDRVVARHG